MVADAGRRRAQYRGRLLHAARGLAEVPELPVHEQRQVAERQIHGGDVEHGHVARDQRTGLRQPTVAVTLFILPGQGHPSMAPPNFRNLLLIISLAPTEPGL